ncbi:tetratricopeptide repeat-containing sulfotransferase family protein [uncultured Sulfitobacter sp.]|jgi:tetratricopeptide (TPR) repeat protein|uniref:tetratricopeptide repeat-containing sulfotransferase family protein n=1 Tax=Sulfitobacter sp. SH22 TaxID=3421172 RepID=UPI0025DAA742|nr:tetratricopeptide repeat-containing sulfotransferase family protein [uncultured Sulfitobacter sp.]
MPKPAPIAKILATADKARAAKDWHLAQSAYQDVLDRFPGNSRAKKGLDAVKSDAMPELFKIARSAKDTRKWNQAERALTLAVALAPEVLPIKLALAESQLERRQLPAALATIDHVLELAPNDHNAKILRGRALHALGQGAAAEDCFLAALGHESTDAAVLNHLGVLARAQGDKSKSETYFRRAIALEPETLGFHSNFSKAITYTKDEPHLKAMINLAASIDPADIKAAPLYFALYKAMEDLGDFPAAFKYLEVANRLTKAAIGYEFEKDAVNYGLAKALFKERIEPIKGEHTFRPIFVTGLPRSGTTLVERILSRGQGVQPCGELSVVQTEVLRLIDKVKARGELKLTTDDIAELGAALREALAKYSDGSPIIIDKMPLNFRWIGFLCAALPEAKIVHTHRDLIPVAWSLYSHAFDGIGNGFIYDFFDIARFMVIYRDLMAHWHSCYPNQIFDLDYQKLVDDPVSVTRALAEATDLEWSTDWLSPEQAVNHVLTASADQVRKPIYRNSGEKWKKYEEEFRPMTELLKSAKLI